MSIVGSERENDEYGRYFDRMSPVTLLQDYKLAKDDVLTKRMKKFPISSTEYGGFYAPGSPVPDPPRPFFSRSHSRLVLGKKHRLHAPYISPGSIEHKWKPPRESRFSPPPPTYSTSHPQQHRREPQYTHHSEPEYWRDRQLDETYRYDDDYRRRDGDFRLPGNQRQTDHLIRRDIYRDRYQDNQFRDERQIQFRERDEDFRRNRYEDRFETLPIRDLDEDDPRRRYYDERYPTRHNQYMSPARRSEPARRAHSMDAAEEMERRSRDPDYWDRYRAYRSGYRQLPDIRTDLDPYRRDRFESYPRVPASYLY